MYRTSYTAVVVNMKSGGAVQGTDADYSCDLWSGSFVASYFNAEAEFCRALPFLSQQL